MNLQEFIVTNSDILLQEVTPDNMASITEGTVLFQFSLASGNKPKAERKIISASYAMAVHTASDDHGVDAVNVLAVTNSGYAKVETIDRSVLGNKKGNKVAYFAKPLPVGDPRCNKLWDNWPKAKLVVMVTRTETSDKITTASVWDNRSQEYMTEENVSSRGIAWFLGEDDMKETLNWNLNGDSSKYRFVWGEYVDGVQTGTAYIFD